ncbi:MAG: ATP-binding protein [Planctomycetota bacterium]
MASEGPISRSIVLESVPSALVEVCKRLLQELKANGFSQEDVFAIHLALEEAFLNAIKHGNKMDARKEIKIDYMVDPDRIEICLTDEGNGFDPESVPDPRRSENLYRTHGRGLFLIRSYMDVVEFNERGNCVRMIRYREKPPLRQPWDQARA